MPINHTIQHITSKNTNKQVSSKFPQKLGTNIYHKTKKESKLEEQNHICIFR